MIRKGNKSLTEKQSAAAGTARILSKGRIDLQGMKLGNPLKSVGMRISLVLIFSTLVFVFAVGLTSYKISADIIKSKVAESNESAITQASGKLDLILKGYEELSMQLFLDTDIQAALASITGSSTEDYEKFEYTTKLDKKMQGMLLSDQKIAAIHFETMNGAKVFSTSSGLNEEIRKKPWYKEVHDGNGKLVWLATELKGYGGLGTAPTFGLGRVLKNVNTGDSQYLMVIELFSKKLEEEVASLKGSSGSTVRLVAADNTILASSTKEELLKKSDIPLPKDLSKHNKGNFNQNKRLVVYNKLATAPWLLESSIPDAELVKDTKKIWNFTLLIAAAAALVACLVGYIMAKLIGGPLNEMKNLMSAGEQGDLTVRTSIKRSDEIGALGYSFNQMMDKITQLVKQTNGSAQDVLHTAQELSTASRTTAVSAREISIATEEIANGASSLAVEAERGNDITFSIGNQMKAVMDANGRMGDSAREVRENSEQGARSMSELITKTSATEEMTRSMLQKVEKLKSSAQSIRKILDLLNNITKQTNILSLNATIEASRAGAAGKGFMVVADEIRNLADQSRQSIEVVGQITETIQHEVDETVGALSAAYPMFQEQIVSVKEADQIFRTVNTQMSEFIASLGNATESIQALNETQGVLSEAMSNVSAVAQQSSATSEEVASLSSEQLNIGEGLVKLSEKLENVSTELKEQLSRFRTE
ncbi:methyl-accepting chemotaxis protein [Paenibacillus gansuensis]|uniref:Methyl-accepting chemotaxis protein n=1 Tax=Paenibacillus gansuensis TaxID=306542 RepID=A0ABW5PDV6_9BACL